MPFLRLRVGLTTGCSLLVPQQWDQPTIVISVLNSGITPTIYLSGRIEIGPTRKCIRDDVKSSWFILDGEVVIREE